MQFQNVRKNVLQWSESDIGDKIKNRSDRSPESFEKSDSISQQQLRQQKKIAEIYEIQLSRCN